ncbi:30S ribosomal protein S6 [candidate division KSB1 bacterium]|nr:30S ribosomal protein S6 [candidate division KSB1 bacterium]
MQKYETIFIIDSLLKSEEIDSIINKYERFLSANGGQIETVERWGKKRLAYEIKKRQYGYYVVIRFSGPPTMIKQLEREYRLNESLLRFKTLAMPKGAVQAVESKIAADKTQKPEAAVEKAPLPEPQAATDVADDAAAGPASEPQSVESAQETADDETANATAENKAE